MSACGIVEADDGRQNHDSNYTEGEDVEMNNINWEEFDRMSISEKAKYGFLYGIGREFKKVDISTLEFADRKDLLNRLLKNVHQNEQLLKKITTRLDRVALDLPTIEVRFKNLNVEGYAYVGQRGLPSMYNSFISSVESRVGAWERFIGVQILFPPLACVTLLPPSASSLSPSLLTPPPPAMKQRKRRRRQWPPEKIKVDGSLTPSGVLSYLHLLPSQKKKLQILHGISGVIKPGRMTLLLGPSGSGKSTLLLALSGLLDAELKVSGQLTYNGYGLHEFVPQKTSAYVSQTDIHIGEMTVRETLTFSARCQGVGSRYDMLLELLKKETEQNIRPDPFVDVLMKASLLNGQKEHMTTEYVLKILGLEECADTIIGDSMTRGISGGQKKRVTIGEMLVGPAMAYFMDSITVGLDSSTTFQIINAIRQSVHILKKTAVISLLQPPPETYELFDDIILLSEGRILYHGPIEHVLEFFGTMGFRCPERKAVADFLQEVISQKNQAQYWAREGELYSYISTKEFADAFQTFDTGRRNEDEVATPYDKSRSQGTALTKSKYRNKKELFFACLSREFLLMNRNLLIFAFQMIQLVVLGLITATAFLGVRGHHDTIEDGKIYMNAVFVGLMTILLSGFTVLPMTISKLPIYYKQRSLCFYPAWAYSFPTLTPGILLSLIEVILWVATTYFIIGFDTQLMRQV
ncbi:hypothetical protein Dimus_034420 [Dionaea muscipula]